MTEDEFMRVAAALHKQYGVPDLAPGEFTISTLASELGITYNRAKPLIERGLAAGELEPIGLRRLPYGHHAQAYRGVVR